MLIVSVSVRPTWLAMPATLVIGNRYFDGINIALLSTTLLVSGFWCIPFGKFGLHGDDIRSIVRPHVFPIIHNFALVVGLAKIDDTVPRRTIVWTQTTAKRVVVPVEFEGESILTFETHVGQVVNQISEYLFLETWTQLVIDKIITHIFMQVV